MESLLEPLAASSAAQWMRVSRWGYAAINSMHVLGIALLVGAMVPMNLKLLGAWRSVSVDSLAKVLVPCAAVGLVLAVLSGSLLFLADPGYYLSLDLFLFEMALLFVVVGHAVVLRKSVSSSMTATRQGTMGISSLVLWVVILLSGRFIAFAGD